MKLNATEQVIVNEVMNEWRSFVKPSKGILINDPAEHFGGSYTFETYALEWVEGVINFNNYDEILEAGEYDNIKTEVINRVKKAIEKDRKITEKLMQDLNIKGAIL